jgi:hypothetical protein
MLTGDRPLKVLERSGRILANHPSQTVSQNFKALNTHLTAFKVHVKFNQKSN